MRTNPVASMVPATSIAVVGASERNLIARIAIGNLLRLRYHGRVVGIHPSGRPIDGVPTFPSYDEAGGPVDLALFAVGTRRLVEAVRIAAAAGITVGIVPGAGSNEGGRHIEEDLRRALEETGMRVLGPNCMGFASLHERVVPYVGTLDPDLPPGRVGLVSQSGSVCELFTTMPWRVGFSHVVSVGNEISIDLTTALEFLVGDPRTEVVGLFVEGIRRPERFRAALRGAAEAGKPVVALKVGRSPLSRAGTVSHTGALAGDARVFSAVLRDTGTVEVHDLDEMHAALEVLGKGLRRDPERVVFVGDSGGEGNLFSDLAAERNVALPTLRPETCGALRERFPSLEPCANPLDLWALGQPEADYRDGLGLVLRHEPHLLVFGVDKFLARGEPERAFVRAGIDGIGEPGAVILMAFGGGDDADGETLRTSWERAVPVVRGADRVLSTLSGIARWRAWRQQNGGSRPRIDPGPIRERAEATTSWTEHAAKELVAAAGIPVTREREVRSVEEAVAASREIGFPVVAKIAGPGVAHKTEADGVRLGLATEQEVAAAVEDLLSVAPRALVAKQRRARLELIAGAFVDDQFGPCGLLGLGGVWTEVFGEAAAVAGPGSPATVRRALETAPWGHLLLRGARGHRFPVERIVDAVLRLVALVEACRDTVSTVEINPLFVEGNDVVAVDALVVAREEEKG